MSRACACLGLIASLGCRLHFDEVGTGDGGNPGDGGPADTLGDGVTPVTPYNFVFVTSTSVRPVDLGGLAGADARCNALAAAAGLPGTYVAWLSDATSGAASRLGAARGWVRVDGKPVVDTVADLLAGKILHPILFNEKHEPITGQFGILTATSQNGTLAEDCLGFTSTAMTDTIMTGIASATFSTWTQNMPVRCDSTYRHYCFGIDRTVPLTFTAAIGRRAFVTANSWAPGGVAAADTTCQAAADARALGGTWRALIATTTASAASRFNPNGPPWVRLDGIALAASASAMLDGMVLEAPLNYTETGQYRGSNPAASGATSTTALGTEESTCRDWTSTLVTDSHRVGLLNSITLYFATPILQTCSSGGGALYCLEP